MSWYELHLWEGVVDKVKLVNDGTQMPRVTQQVFLQTDTLGYDHTWTDEGILV